jgi:hypothetical protein
MSKIVLIVKGAVTSIHNNLKVPSYLKLKTKNNKKIESAPSILEQHDCTLSILLFNINYNLFENYLGPN